MTDRELLELAAKAAGIVGVYSESIGEDWGRHPGEKGMNVSGRRWNPLEDDGDALRLAVKLRMLVDPLNRAVGGYLYIEIPQEELDKNPYAATRRAIVRAAAAIGKDMP
jgi:hypothetical protein